MPDDHSMGITRNFIDTRADQALLARLAEVLLILMVFFALAGEPVPHVNRYAVGDNRIDVLLDDGGTSSLWWATKNEWLGLVDVAGLEVETLYGGFAGEPFTDDCTEYVFVARRRCPQDDS